MGEEKYIITKVEVQKRNKNRVNVYINNEFSFACSAELVYTYNLSKDKVVDMDSLVEIVNEDNFIKCKSTSLKTIERAYKTEKQITDKLLQKGYDEKVIDRTRDFLKQYDFINDDKYVDMYIKDKINTEGRNKIKYTLINRGIREDVLNQKLSNIEDDLEEKLALKLAEKKYALLAKDQKDIRTIQKKLNDFLVRKGYSFDIIQRVSKEVIKPDLHLANENFEEDDFHNTDELYELAEKRHSIMIKSESDSKKIYKKLGDYLLRRGYSWEDVKSVLYQIIK